MSIAAGACMGRASLPGAIRGYTLHYVVGGCIYVNICFVVSIIFAW